MRNFFSGNGSLIGAKGPHYGAKCLRNCVVVGVMKVVVVVVGTLARLALCPPAHPTLCTLAHPALCSTARLTCACVGHGG